MYIIVFTVLPTHHNLGFPLDLGQHKFPPIMKITNEHYYEGGEMKKLNQLSVSGLEPHPPFHSVRTEKMPGFQRLYLEAEWELEVVGQGEE